MNRLQFLCKLLTKTVFGKRMNQLLTEESQINNADSSADFLAGSFFTYFERKFESSSD